MPTLHYGSGSSGYTVDGPAMSEAEWAQKLAQLKRILAKRGQRDALALLERWPWEIRIGDNWANDEFQVLYVELDTDAYVDAGGLEADQAIRAAARTIARTYDELNMGYMRFVGFGLRSDDEPPPAAPAPTVTSATVRRALDDADILLTQGRASSAVDRAHTALHGYLTERARRLGIDIGGEGAARLSSAKLYKLIRQNHPAFQTGPHAEHAAMIAQSFAMVVDRMDTLRNNASVAHPNDELLDEPEAHLVISAAWALIRYIDARLSALA